MIFRLGTQNLKPATDGTPYSFFSLRKPEIENGSEDGAVRAERYEGSVPRVPHSKIAVFAILEWGVAATSAATPHRRNHQSNQDNENDGRHALSFLVGCPTLVLHFLRARVGIVDFRPYSIDETESSSSSSTDAAKPAPRNPTGLRAGSMLMSNAIFSSSQR